ncbi:MAG: MarR family transcriptional regulator [Methylococcaceae bacterium]|nr:MarR family transcriptional regulator [Methylococcaceae bacterium]
MYSKFGFLSYEISHTIRQRFNKNAESFGLTHAQWRALVHLSENKNCRQVDLAEILEVKPITLARQIDLLETAGLVRRNKDSDDRRAYRLELMPKALPIMAALWQITDTIEDEILAILSTEDKSFLINSLENIKNNLSEKLLDTVK